MVTRTTWGTILNAWGIRKVENHRSRLAAGTRRLTSHYWYSPLFLLYFSEFGILNAKPLRDVCSVIWKSQGCLRNRPRSLRETLTSCSVLVLLRIFRGSPNNNLKEREAHSLAGLSSSAFHRFPFSVSTHPAWLERNLLCPLLSSEIMKPRW